MRSAIPSSVVDPVQAFFKSFRFGRGNSKGLIVLRLVQCQPQRSSDSHLRERAPINRPNEGHHIVVIGDGADSFVLAARLAHKLGRDGKALVTLVDQSMSTRWTPFLDEVEGVVFNESAANAARAMPKTLHPFQLRLGRIDAIDRVKKEITLALVADEEGRELIPARRLDYDTLILEPSQNLYEVVR